MTPVRASLTIAMLAGLTLAGCTAAPAAPDAATLDDFGEALAAELEWIGNERADPDGDEQAIRDRIAGLGTIAGVSVDQSIVDEIGKTVRDLSFGNDVLTSSTVVTDDWSIIENSTDRVVISFDVHFVRELEELGPDAWEEVIPYEVTFDRALESATAIVIRDKP